MHAAVDAHGRVLDLRTSAANDQDRAHIGALAAEVQAATGDNVTLAHVDQATPA